MDKQVELRESVRILIAQGEAARQRAEAHREQTRIKVAAMTSRPGEKYLAAMRQAKAATSH